VIFPIRRGVVVNSKREGDIFLVDFTVKDFVSLKDPKSNPDGYPGLTAQYRDRLESHSLPLPYDKYVILADYDAVTHSDSLLDSSSGSDENVPIIFRRSIEYLSRTDTYAAARFAYVSKLTSKRSSKPKHIDSSSHGYKLTAGHEYELEFLQAQSGPMDNASVMNILVDERVIKVIGPAELSIGSSYDVQTLRIVTLPASSLIYTTIGLRPGVGMQGPVLNIPVEVCPPNLRRLGVALGTAFGLVILGLSTVIPKINWSEKLGIVAFGALLASLLNTFGWSTKTL
jgi:hypothetical protein